MIRRGIYLFVLFTGFFITAQGGILDRVQKSLDKKDYEKAEKLARKTLEKDTLNPGAKYYLSVLFLTDTYSIYNIDSASIYIHEALLDLELAGPEIKEELTELQLNKTEFEKQLGKVSSAVFTRVLQQISIENLEQFVSQYPDAEQVKTALSKRDSLAYLEAQLTNTWQSYKEFAIKYPQAEQVKNAWAQYQRLVYEEYTKDNTLSSLKNFIKTFPDSPYRAEAEQRIFKQSTKTNSLNDYWNFMNSYPKSRQAITAGNILYHRIKNNQPEELKKLLNQHPLKDSLGAIHKKETQMLLPVFVEDEFRFMTDDGNLLKGLTYSGVNNNYLCGNIKDSWLQVTSEKLGEIAINRNGSIMANPAKSLKKISESIWLLPEAEKLYHSSGFSITKLSVSDASELPNGWIAIKHDYDWGIIHPLGLPILPPKYTSIKSVGPFIILEEKDKYVFTTFDKILKNQFIGATLSLDDYEVIGDSIIQVFSGDREGLIDTDLKLVLPLSYKTIYLDESFCFLSDSTGRQLVQLPEFKVSSELLYDLQVNLGWAAYQKDSLWSFRSRLADSLQTFEQIDTLKLLTDNAIWYQKADSSQILWQSGRTLLLEDEQVTVVPSKRSPSAYISVSSGTNQVIFDRYGMKLFETEAVEISTIADSLFKIKYAAYSGVVDFKNNRILPVEYEVIERNGDLLFLLKKGKIGAFDIKNKTIIPPEYEAKIEKISQYYLVKKEGLMGVVNQANDWVIQPEYSQILHWNDTSAWVRKSDKWSLLAFDETEIISGIVSVRSWLNVKGEKLYIVLGTDGYGLMSDQRGELLPMQYNEIINVGSDDQPMFFAEQHLKTAAFFVVTYFNILGESIRSQAFRPEEYDRIYCDQ